MNVQERRASTSLVALLTLALSLVGFGAAFQAGAQALTYEGRTLLDGVFTEAQAIEGGDRYETNCVRCHEGIDPDGPTLRGRSFINRWRESNLDTLYTHISSRMPADGAGQLSDESYIQILAYILGSNGYPAGAEELLPEALARVRIVGMDGPQPPAQQHARQARRMPHSGGRGLLDTGHRHRARTDSGREKDES